MHCSKSSWGHSQGFQSHYKVLFMMTKVLIVWDQCSWRTTFTYLNLPCCWHHNQRPFLVCPRPAKIRQVVTQQRTFSVAPLNLQLPQEGDINSTLVTFSLVPKTVLVSHLEGLPPSILSIWSISQALFSVPIYSEVWQVDALPFEVLSFRYLTKRFLFTQAFN